MERETEGLQEKLEAFFLKYPPLLDTYLIDLQVLRDLKDAPESEIFKRHKVSKEFIEDVATGKKTSGGLERVF